MKRTAVESLNDAGNSLYTQLYLMLLDIIDPEILKPPPSNFYKFLVFELLMKNMYATEAFVRNCFVKKMFLEISQSSQENTCARVPF